MTESRYIDRISLSPRTLATASLATAFLATAFLATGRVCSAGDAIAPDNLQDRSHVDAKKNRKLPARVARFDKDGDGRISSAEMPPAFRERALERYDKNKDGALDARELRAFMADRRSRTRKQRPAERSKKTGTTQLNERVRLLEDIDYATGPSYGASKGKLDLYLPRGDKEFPVLFFIHCGGLHGGDKSKLAGVGERFALHGFGVVTANYRLAPAVKFPAQIEDVARAFRWVYDHIARYGGDRDRLFVAGGSAGGYLTALLTLDERYLQTRELSGSNIRASIPISGLMDVARTAPGRLETTWKNDPEIVKEASPLTHVRKDAPPILIMFADGEKPGRARQNRDTFEALKKAGHPHVQLKVLKDRTHNTIRPNMAKEGDEALVTMLEFLRKHGAWRSPSEE